MDHVNERLPLTIDVNGSGTTTAILSLEGDIDLEATHALRAAIFGAVENGAICLVLDVTGVRFMDSSGISLLLESRLHFVSLKLRAPSPAIRRLIELTGLHHTIEISD